MYSLWIFGQVLEPMLGKFKFAALYLVSLFGSSVGVLWLAPADGWVLGASGAIFGLMAAYFVILRSIGQNTSQVLGLIAVNLMFGFFVAGVSWQAHVGGLVTGGAIALVYSGTRNPSQTQARWLSVSAIVVVLGFLTAFRTGMLGL
jgi:membrane associated rhomboid family serine protease